MIIERYTPEHKALWDDTVRNSRNGIFLHLRDYMDYHADRFEDHSLMARDDKGRLIAVLPANRRGNLLQSHAGLTFGGWLMTDRADLLAMTAVWREMVAYLLAQGISEIDYRPTPHIYHRSPAEDDIYALMQAGGSLSAVLPSTVISLSDDLGFDMANRQSVSKATRAGVLVQKSDDWEAYWNMLTERLAERFDARPVHTLDEILRLKTLFPDNIELYTATLDGRMLAGIVMYTSRYCAHSQYTASTEDGRRARVIPLIYRHILNQYQDRVRYFDLGTSIEADWHEINEGLVRQKAGFGGRTIAYNRYHISLK